MSTDIEYYLKYYKVPDNFKPFLRASGQIRDTHYSKAYNLSAAIVAALKSWSGDYRIRFKYDSPLAHLEDGEVVMHPGVRMDWENSIPGFLAEAKHPIKGMKYRSEERQLSVANKQQKLSLPKYIKLSTNVDELSIKDDVVRKAAEFVLGASSELTMVICEKPEDYITMFSVRTMSCMAGITEATDRPGIKALFKAGMHPASWYHFTKHSKGFYIVCKDMPIARGMLYREDLSKDVWPLYGDFHFGMYGMEAQLHDFVRKKGYAPVERQVTTLAPFEIPGVKNGDDYVCPLPHCDNQVKDFTVVFDKTRKVFCFDKNSSPERSSYGYGAARPSGKPTPIYSTYNYDYNIPASQISQI